MIDIIKIVDDLLIAQFEESSFSDVYFEKDKFIKNIITLLKEKNVKILAVNMGNIYNVDSRGLGFMIKMHNQILTQNMELIFFNLQSMVNELIELSTMDKILYVMTKEEFETIYLEK